jgi:hypothetical protein
LVFLSIGQLLMVGLVGGGQALLKRLALDLLGLLLGARCTADRAQIILVLPGTYLLRRFEDTACKECGMVFKLIDKYNDPNTETTSHGHCTEACKQAARFRDVQEFRLVNEGRSPAVIYQVRQKSTGRVYVGQTTQPFTLRWWQHLSNPTNCKFHSALGSSNITDWEFSVIEVIVYPEGCTNRATYITQREGHWIEALSAVDIGFNTVRPTGTADQAQVPLPLADMA